MEPDDTGVEGYGESRFWDGLDALVAECQIIIDQPRGSRHPRYPNQEYPLDYGHLQGSSTGDSDGVGVWIGSSLERSLDGLALTLDLSKRQAEIEVLLGCSQAEQELVLGFLNSQGLRATLLRRRARGLDLLFSRRSVRRFQPHPLPRRTLERLLEAASWAPSSHNRQPWRFLVLTSLGAKERLAQCMGSEFRRDLLGDGLDLPQVEAQVARSHDRILEAPAALVLCQDLSLGDRYPDEKRQRAEELMGVQSAAMAGENLLLAAHALGLGGVWMCAPLFAPQAVQQAFDLPADWRPEGLVLLGYPASSPPARPRRPLEEIVRFIDL